MNSFAQLLCIRAIAFALTLATATGSLKTVDAGSPVFVGKADARPVEIGRIDHSIWSELLSTYVDENGHVDYRRWHQSRIDRSKLDKYLTILSAGADGTLPGSTKTQRLAFWINAYNALTIKGILREYPTTSIRNHTPKLWGYHIWHDLKLFVGGKAFSLDEIEHQILRPMDEPRIHFAIVCASISCPRLLNEAYLAESLDQQLTDNAKDFFRRRQNFRFDVADKRFYLSAILDWFAEDFGDGQAARLKTIATWLPDQSAKKAAIANSVRVSYIDYNWNLNSQR